jgi:integrase
MSLSAVGYLLGVVQNIESKLRFSRDTPTDFDSFCLYVIGILPIKVKTRESYLSAFRCHIQGVFVGKRVNEVTKVEIQLLLAPLKPQIRAKVLAILKTIFREAILLELIDVAPTVGIRNPAPIVEMRKFFTWDEVKAREFGPYTNQIQFLALHGLRWGEAVVLTESDIRNGRVYINKSIHGGTKSQSGNRVVPLVSTFQPFPKSPKTLRKVLDPHGIHIHSLRHTYAYTLKSQGIHVTTAQKLMGHSDPKITMAIYTRVLDNEIDSAGAILRGMMN